MRLEFGESAMWRGKPIGDNLGKLSVLWDEDGEESRGQRIERRNHHRYRRRRLEDEDGEEKARGDAMELRGDRPDQRGALGSEE